MRSSLHLKALLLRGSHFESLLFRVPIPGKIKIQFARRIQAKPYANLLYLLEDFMQCDAQIGEGGWVRRDAGGGVAKL